MELPVFGGFEPSIMRLIQTGVLQTQHVEHSAFNMEIRTFDHETNSDKQTRHAEHSPSNMELPAPEELSVVEKACTALDKVFRSPLTNSLKLIILYYILHNIYFYPFILFLNFNTLLFNAFD